MCGDPLSILMQGSSDRTVELLFNTCTGCPYEWELGSNSYTKLIKVPSLVRFMNR